MVTPPSAPMGEMVLQRDGNGERKKQRAPTKTKAQNRKNKKIHQYCYTGGNECTKEQLYQGNLAHLPVRANDFPGMGLHEQKQHT